MRQFGSARAFSFNSAESEPIWMKSGALWVGLHRWGLAIADFGRDLRSSDSLRGKRNFYCLVTNARFRRFPVYNISRNLNTTTSIGEAMKTFGTEF